MSKQSNRPPTGKNEQTRHFATGPHRPGTARPSASAPPASAPPPSSVAPGNTNDPYSAPLSGEVEEEDGLVGEVVANRYRVLRKMGEGGMGTVYLSEHVAIEKKVALKVLLHEYARKEDLKERFLQEARAAARIGHENIVDITDFGRTPDNSVFFAMEFLDGVDLSMAMKEGPMAWSRAKPILLQICRAMGAAHSKGIIHRDMKPENIFLIEREGRGDFVKVLDFGIAKMSNLSDGERRLTRTGMIFGTPEYMSPEQAQGHQPDHRVDIYALGVIMYEMLTGQVPFKADTFMGILTKHIFEKPVPPREHNGQIPAEVEEIVLKAMAKDREERFRSMTEMAAAIVSASGRMTRPTGDQATVLRSVTPAPSKVPMGEPIVPPRHQIDADVERIPSSGGRLIAAVAVGLIVVGGLVAYGLLREGDSADAGGTKQAGTTPTKAPSPPPPPPRPPEPAPSKTVKVTIRTEPPGAAIYAGDKQLGMTPEILQLPRGDRKVLLTLKRDGFEELRLPVLPSEDHILQEKLTQIAAAPPPRRRRVRRPPRTKRQPPAKTKVARPPAKRSPQRVDDLMDPFADDR